MKQDLDSKIPTGSSNLTSGIRGLSLTKSASRRVNDAVLQHELESAVGWKGQSLETDVRSTDQIHVPHPLAHTTLPYAASNYAPSSRSGSPTTTSFSSAQSGEDRLWEPYQVQFGSSNIHGGPYFINERSRNGPNPVQVYQATHIPQPDFDTVSSTPVFPQTYAISFPDCKQLAEVPQNIYGSNGFQDTVTMVPYANPEHAMTGQQHPATAASTEHASNMSTAHCRCHYHASGSYIHPGYYTTSPDDYGYVHIPGLPVAPMHGQPEPQENDPHLPFSYPEPKPDADFPVPPLPGNVIRGFTGHASGVGKYLSKTKSSACSNHACITGGGAMV